MGNRGCSCGGRDSRRHHVLRWSSLIGLRSAAPDEIASWHSRGLVFWMLVKTDVF